MRPMLAMAVILGSSFAVEGSQTQKTKPVPLYQEAYAHTTANNWPKAIELWKQFLSEHGKDRLAGNARLNLGICLFQTKQFGEAANELDMLTDLADFQDQPKALLLLGRARLEQARGKADREFLSAALAAFDKLQDKHPKSPLAIEATVYGAEARGLLGEFDVAAKDLGDWLMDHSTHALAGSASYLRGTLLYQAKKFDDAVDQLTKFLTDHGNHPQAANAKLYRGLCQSQRNQWQSAKDDLLAVVEAKTASTDLALFALGWVARQLKEDARKWYVKLAAEHPASPYACAALLAAGDLARRDGDAPTVREHYESLLKQHGKSKEAAKAELGLALLAFDAKDYSKATTLFAKIVERGENDATTAEAALGLGEVLAAQEKTADAADHFVSVAGRYAAYADQAGEAWFRASQCFEACGQSMQAANCLKQLKKLYPTHARAK